MKVRELLEALADASPDDFVMVMDKVNPELNRADLTARAFALTVTNAKKAGKRTLPVEELEKVVADPMRVGSRTRETVALAWVVAGWVVRMHTERKRRAA